MHRNARGHILDRSGRRAGEIDRRTLGASARELTNKTAEVKSLAQQTACRGAPTASVGVRSRLPTR
jgi:hypothetical protein